MSWKRGEGKGLLTTSFPGLFFFKVLGMRLGYWQRPTSIPERLPEQREELLEVYGYVITTEKNAGVYLCIAQILSR